MERDWNLEMIDLMHWHQDMTEKAFVGPVAVAAVASLFGQATLWA